MGALTCVSPSIINCFCDGAPEPVELINTGAALDTAPLISTDQHADMRARRPGSGEDQLMSRREGGKFTRNKSGRSRRGAVSERERERDLRRGRKRQREKE